KIQDPKNRDAVAICWTSAGQISSYQGTTNKNVKTGVSGTGPHTFQILINANQNSYSLWMDNNKLVTNWALRYAPQGGISQFYAYMQKANAYTAYFDDLKVYESMAPDEEKTLYDKVWLKQEMLTQESADAVTQNLTLPQQGEYGSSIVWTSSNPSVVAPDGTVHVPNGADVTVTMTAAITSGESRQEKTFTLTVKGNAQTVVGPAPVGDYIVQDDFSGTLDTRIEPLLTDQGTLEIQNEKLALTRVYKDTTGEKKDDRFRYHFKEDKTGMTQGVYGIEVTVEREVDGQEIWFKIQDPKNRDAVAICWTSTGEISSYQGKTNKNVKTGVSGTGPHTFQILINVNQNSYSLWMDNNKLVTNWALRYDPQGGISQFYAYLQRAHAYTAYFDDLKVYESMVPDEEKTLYDKVWLKQEMLTQESADAVTQNLTLPQQGEYGSDISWTSSAPSILSPAGQVTIPKENTPVTMTATITSGAYTQQKEFAFIVPAGEVLEVPVPKEGYLVQDSFEGEQMDSRIVKYGADGTLRQSGGRIGVTRTSTAQETSDGFRYYFKDDHTGIGKDVVALEFTLEKSEANKEVLFRVRGAGDKDYVAATWLANGSVTSYIGGTNKTVKTGLSDKGPHKITILINTVYNLYSMWIDGKRVVENGETRGSEADGPAQLLTWVQRANAYTYYVDDFAVYEPEIPDLEKVGYDERWLTAEQVTFQPLSAVTMNLSLPQTGKYGSSIVWTSSNPSVVAPDGTVTRSEDTAHQVTLTAQIKSGTKTAEKQFDVQVLKKSRPGMVPQVDGTPIYVHMGEQNMLQSYYFSANKAPFSGEYALQFTLVHPDLAANTTVALKSGAQSALELQLDNGNLRLLSRAALGTAAKWQIYQSGVDITKPVQIHVLVSTRANKCSVWINGEKAADAVFTAEQISNVDHFTVQSMSTVQTQDISFYRPIIPDADKILLDDTYLTWEHLTWQDASYVFEDLPLPQTGMFGSSIRWESSAADTVSADGTVTRPASGSKEVRLTAAMAAGEETKVKTFDLKVVAVQDDEMPEIGELIMSDDCSGTEPAAGWEFVQGGGTVEQRFGSVEITRYENKDSTTATRYFSAEQTEYTGILGLEFTLRKSAAKDLQLRVVSGYDYFALNWLGAGTIRVNYNVSADSAETWYNVAQAPGLSAKFNLLFNTEEGTYSLWVNNKMLLHNVYARGKKARGVQLIRTWLEKGNFATVSIDNIKLYRSCLLQEDRVTADEQWLTLDKLLTGETHILTPNTVDSNLNLLQKGYYGSDITWESSNTDLIGTDGSVHCPDGALGEDPQVTLTATIRAGEQTRQKQITVYVKRNLSDPQDCVAADLGLLTLSRISPENSERIKMSLNFAGKGLYGSEIVWSSSDPDTVGQSGRVIRPKAGEADRTVQVTARVSNGGAVQEKQFTFTVLADEVFTDPQHMDDSTFFGVWDSEANTWTVQGKLDYTFHEKLEAVGEAVKAGDLPLAKQRLLEYMRDKENKYSIGLGRRDTNWSNMIIDDFYHLRGSEFYQGEFVAGGEFQTVSAAVKPADITPGAPVTYALTAWYNEASELQIYSQNCAESNKRPRMEVKVNGKMQTFEAVDDVTIRAGEYKNTNYGGEEILKVKTYGDFLGNETYKAMLKFDFSSLRETDSITEARLVLTAKADPAFAGEKRIMVQQEPTTLWSEEAVWNTFPGYIYSFNGLPGKNDWRSPENADVEYLYQMVRFSTWVPVALEYKLTNDEKYAYGALQIMADFIRDVGGWTTSAAPAKRGGYMRSLDSAIRLQNWERSYDAFVDSPYMTPELNTAILKAIYDMADCLKYHHAASGNWQQTEYMSMLQTSLLFPEFMDAKKGDGNWFETATAVLEPLIYKNILPDGSYVEATGSYNVGAYGSFRGFKSTMRENGVEVSAEYNERLRKGAYYNALLFAPDGKSIQYGDEPYSQWSPHYTDVAQWFGDKELLYIDTLGAQGIAPEWTSTQFPDSKISIMRSDWGKKALYLFTNVRGGGQHGHDDANHITVAAYGRILLNDGGIFTYTATDPYRIWGKSSTGHNTVVINGQDQRQGADTGEINQWTVGSNYNYLSQTTTATQGYTHNRKITFIKPSFWIVSDKITPEAGYMENEYKQNWHMLPGANLTVDSENNVLRSNYTSGANIIVASADKEALAKEEQGWYDKSYGEVVPAKYGYFQKENVTGAVTFDTVLVPTENDPNATVTVNKLSSGADATALEIHMHLKNAEKTGWYYQTDNQNPSAAQFGGFVTDAQMAYVETDDAGTVKMAVLQNGTYIRTAADGKDVVRLAQRASVTLERVGSKLVIGTVQKDGGITGQVEREPLPETLIAATGTVKKMEVNGAAVSFGSKEGYLVPYGKGGGSENGDKTQGGIVPPGGGAGGGGTSGGNTTPTNPVTPTDTPTGTPTPTPSGGAHQSGFIDVRQHWAKVEIEDLAKQNIVKGSAEGLFLPDDNITRAEFLALLQRATGAAEEPYTGTFTDVSAQDWYAGAVQFGISGGIVAKAEQFRPNDNITRAEMAKLLTETCLRKGLSVPEEYQADYADIDRESWYAPYIDAADYLDLIRGMENGMFAPQENATRAQGAVMIWRYLKKTEA
ncbi:MAG: DNRLRE domain-containing protein, partial [Clostridia bacterium]|nr:DNRLRE domain-containing protein [Clostridia bacterium]